MSVLSGKKILLGISGGIAAYKSASLVRLFIKSGAEVQVVMTTAAKDFVTPLTLATLSKNPVYSNFFDPDDDTAVWNNHVDLGLWAGIFVIAPATASTLSKLASGNSDNFLTAVYLSAKCPVFVAPAMDLDMYAHQSTRENLALLQKFGNTIIPAESGELASGLSGEGRMAEPENIISQIEKYFESRLPLKDKTILVTAGPTYEAIDPVRFVGNHSSGKMGFDIASEALSLGAKVYLVSGPTALSLSHSNLEIVRVQSCSQMFDACMKVYDDCDVAIAAAAVADFRPKIVASQKIKKSESENPFIELEKTEDILAELGRRKNHQFLIGFALETENEVENAKLKIQKKKLDLIVLNSLNDKGAGFGTDTNKVTFIDNKGKVEALPLKSKIEVAKDILEKVKKHFNA